jgi:hypothetical protein
MVRAISCAHEGCAFFCQGLKPRFSLFLSAAIRFRSPRLKARAWGRSSTTANNSTPGASPGVFLFVQRRCGTGARRDAAAIQVLQSRLRRSFRMTVCCAAILRGAGFLARVGSARWAWVELPEAACLGDTRCRDFSKFPRLRSGFRQRIPTPAHENRACWGPRRTPAQRLNFRLPLSRDALPRGVLKMTVGKRLVRHG